MFALDPRLAADTVELSRWSLSRVLLMNDATYPWLILVPQREGLRELHDLDPAGQAVLMAEVTRASRALAAAVAPDKVNVAALGNVVTQLHMHVVARFRGDPAWPGPVWGQAPPVPYAPARLAATVGRLGAALGER